MLACFLYELVHNIWNTEGMLSPDMKEAAIGSYVNKGDITDCDKYINITIKTDAQPTSTDLQ